MPTKYIFQSGAGAVFNCGSRNIVPSCRTGTFSEISFATCANRHKHILKKIKHKNQTKYEIV
jgi:hypothetical protein